MGCALLQFALWIWRSHGLWYHLTLGLSMGEHNTEPHLYPEPALEHCFRSSASIWCSVWITIPLFHCLQKRFFLAMHVMGKTEDFNGLLFLLIAYSVRPSIQQIYRNWRSSLQNVVIVSVQRFPCSPWLLHHLHWEEAHEMEAKLRQTAVFVCKAVGKHHHLQEQICKVVDSISTTVWEHPVQISATVCPWLLLVPDALS